jgi:acetylornithine deacetylase/succinyl-diaminopimelate desuccinylase-like protein
METGPLSADLKAVTLSTPPADAVARLSARATYNAQLRTTCVATRLEAGHADNALPQVAKALVNCRILPGEAVEEVQKTLIKVLADDQIAVTPTGSATMSSTSPLNEELLGAIEELTRKYWPGIPVLPLMSAGATDGRFLRNAGIPTYGHSGLASDIFDVRAHGKDERVPVKSFYEGNEYLYELVKRLAGDGSP